VLVTCLLSILKAFLPNSKAKPKVSNNKKNNINNNRIYNSLYYVN
jgi:hypothetical protein